MPATAKEPLNSVSAKTAAARYFMLPPINVCLQNAKPVIEAMLAVLGQTLAEGREMNLQPLGKVRINRAKDVLGGKALITKIRQSNRVPKPSADPAAKAAE